MISAEDPELYEATCEDCGSTKSYFTAQGVNYFKMNHEGHKIKVREPGGGEGFPAEPALETPAIQPEGRPVVHEGKKGEGRTKIDNLVVDVMGGGAEIRVFGVGGGREMFAKSFRMAEIGALNDLLEGGEFADGETGTTYTWGPEAVDLSRDVVKMLDEASRQPLEAPVEVHPRVEPDFRPPGPTVMLMPRIPPGESAPLIDAEGLLLAESAYVKEGEEFQLESVRVSKALARFRWKLEPPYVIGAIFDDLLSVQSNTSAFEGQLIDAVTSLGYSVVGVEAPKGVLTVWFRRGKPPNRRRGPDA